MCEGRTRLTKVVVGRRCWCQADVTAPNDETGDSKARTASSEGSDYKSTPVATLGCCGALAGLGRKDCLPDRGCAFAVEYGIECCLTD